MFDLDSKDRWAQDRWGRFTASEMHKLFSKGNGKMFGAGAKTYIRKKAIEKMTVFWENPKLEFVKPLLWGRRYEQPAFEHYVRMTGNIDMRYMGTEAPLFLSWGEDAGGSPDGILGEGEVIHLGLELKNPLDSSVHWDFLQLKDQWDLKEYAFDYYVQAQTLLKITNAPLWHFVSHDERYKEIRKRMALIEIKPDLPLLRELEVRKAQAIVCRDRIISGEDPWE